jgi:hypothetical protein
LLIVLLLGHGAPSGCSLYLGFDPLARTDQS